MRFFISYSHVDHALARRVADSLTRRGADVRLDQDAIPPGASLVEAIGHELEHCDRFVCLVSKDYLASAWCRQEWQVAVGRLIEEGTLSVVPYLVGDVVVSDLPLFLRRLVCLQHDPQQEEQSIRRLLEPSDREPSSVPWVTLPRRQLFVGRQDELERVLVSLRHQRVHITAIEGLGGIGKTSLMLEAAWCAGDQGIFDAFVFISGRHAGLTDVHEAIAMELSPPGITASAERDLDVRQLLAQHRALILIDNFEDIPERHRQDIHHFIADDLPAPSKAVITSRVREVLEARHIALGPLNPADGVVLLENHWEHHAHERLPLGLESIYHAAGGNPHYMKLAVRKLSLGSPLPRVLAWFGEPGSEPSQFYDGLWKELNETEKHILQCLTLFASAGDWDALQHTSGLSDRELDGALQELVRRLLVDSLPSAIPGMRKYDLHPLTRTFASRALASDSHGSARTTRRFVDYFLGFADQYGGRSWSNYAHLERERKNILAAMDYLAKLEDWENVSRLAIQIRHFIVRQESASIIPSNRFGEFFGQALEICRRGAEAAERAARAQDECRFLLEMGNIHIIRRDVDEGRAVLQRCIERSRTHGFTERQIMALRRLGHIEARHGDREAARRYYADSRELAEAQGDRVGLGRALRALGDLYLADGGHDDALACYEESVSYLQNETDPTGFARVLRRIGTIHHAGGRWDKATAAMRRAIESYVGKKDISAAAYALFALGRIEADSGKWSGAAKTWLVALRTLSYIHGEIWARYVETQARREPAVSEPISLAPLEVFVPAIDVTATQCMAALDGAERFLGRDRFTRQRDAVDAAWQDGALAWPAFVELAVPADAKRASS